MKKYDIKLEVVHVYNFEVEFEDEDTIEDIKNEFKYGDGYEYIPKMADDVYYRNIEVSIKED